MTASSMVSPFGILHGLLRENAHVVPAIPAATLAVQQPTGRNQEHLCVHDAFSKITCLVQETAFPRACHNLWGRIAVLTDIGIFLPQCHRHFNQCVLTERAGSLWPFPPGWWYETAGFCSSGPMVFHSCTHHTGRLTLSSTRIIYSATC